MTTGAARKPVHHVAHMRVMSAGRTVSGPSMTSRFGPSRRLLLRFVSAYHCTRTTRQRRMLYIHPASGISGDSRPNVREKPG